MLNTGERSSRVNFGFSNILKVTDLNEGWVEWWWGADLSGLRSKKDLKNEDSEKNLFEKLDWYGGVGLFLLKV